MKLKDEKLEKEIKRRRLYDLEQDIMDITEDEIPGLMKDYGNEWQLVAEELSWILYTWGTDDGASAYQELHEAQRFLQKTKHGKEMPMPWPMPKDIETAVLAHKNKVAMAKEVVNEFGRMLRFMQKLQEAGYYGSHYKA